MNRSVFETEIIEGGIRITGYKGEEKSISIPGMIDGLSVTEIGDGAFAGSDIENVNVPGTVSKIGEMAFFACRNLSSLLLSEGVKELGADFAGLTAIKELHIPKSVTVIHALRDIKFCLKTDGENPVYSADGIALYQKSDNNLVLKLCFAAENENEYRIKDGTVRISQTAFENTFLEKIYIPSSVVDIPDGTFSIEGARNGIKEVVVDERNPRYFADNSALYERQPDGSRLIRLFSDFDCFTVPCEVNSVAPKAFYRRTIGNLDFGGRTVKLTSDAFIASTVYRITFLTGDSVLLPIKNSVLYAEYIDILFANDGFFAGEYDRKLLEGYLDPDNVALILHRLSGSGLSNEYRHMFEKKIEDNLSDIVNEIVRQNDISLFEKLTDSAVFNRENAELIERKLSSQDQSRAGAAGELKKILYEKAKNAGSYDYDI